MTGKEIEKDAARLLSYMKAHAVSRNPEPIDIETAIAIQRSTDLMEVVTSGSPMIFIDAKYKGEPLQVKVGSRTGVLKAGDMLGFINARGTSQFPKELAGRLLEARRRGDSAKKIFDELGSQLPPSYEELCKINDRDNQDVGFLMLVHVETAFRGINLSGMLLGRTLRIMRDRFHLDYAAVYGRVPNLSQEFKTPQEAEQHLQEYVERKRPKDGLHPDHAVRFHQNAGCEIVCGIPNYALDRESLNHGFVGIYDLKKMKAGGRI